MLKKLKATMTAEPSGQAPSTTAPALAQFDNLPSSAHVRLPVVAALHGVGPATIWRWVKAGRLPAPIKLGPNTTAWRVGDLRRVMARLGA
jgi:predicted DNA-binding transcriptional regulator AlpA